MPEDQNKQTETEAQNALSAEILDRLRQEIRDASELLEFAVAEGRQVSDQIIERIKRAEEFLRSTTPPTASDRAAFEKAYRDLTSFLCPITIDGIRTKPIWHWQSPWLWVFVIVVALPTVVGVASKGLTAHNFVVGALYASLASLVLWAFYVFTGAVTNKKLNQIIIFCYVFTVFSLLIPVLPFFAHRFFPGLSKTMVLSPIGIVRGCSEAPAKSAIPEETLCENGNSTQWVINIGGVITTPETERLPHIQGGLVVPLYVVILSLMGSAVSMTRRVPEYQRRALDPKEPFTNAQAREYLVFQIMQVLSAPLIVVTAYYLFGPDTRAKSVLLGFASGFASEPILLAIRGLADKLRPGEAPSTTAGTAPTAVTVSPPTISLKAGESYRFTAMVTPPTANSAITWSIDPPPPDGGDILQTGVYTAPKTIATPRTVTITAHSAADPTKSGKATVNLS